MTELSPTARFSDITALHNAFGAEVCPAPAEEAAAASVGSSSSQFFEESGESSLALKKRVELAHCLVPGTKETMHP